MADYGYFGTGTRIGLIEVLGIGLRFVISF